MESPTWPLWIIGPTVIVAGVLLFKYREKAAYVIRQKNPVFDSSKDSTGEGGFLILPAIMLPLIYAAR